MYQWIMTALRGGYFQVNIKIGRHKTPKTPYHLWTCNLCQLKSVETEFHFVMECPAQQDLDLTFLTAYAVYR